MDLHRLLRPEQPWLHILIANESDACDLVMARPGTHSDQPTLRVIRGHKARTNSNLFDEFAAALQFPCYFGENWDAFYECLTDLTWLPGTSYIFLIARSNYLLEKEPAEQLQRLLKILDNVGETWSKPAPEPNPRAPRSFHILFQCAREDEDALRVKLSAAKVAFDVLRP